MRDFGAMVWMMGGLFAGARAVSSTNAVVPLFRAMAAGQSLIDLVEPSHRDETSQLMAAIVARADRHFTAWAVGYAAPEAELRRALAAYETNAVQRLAEVAERPEDVVEPLEESPVAFAVALLHAAAQRNDDVAGDVIIGDVGAALAQLMRSSARTYRAPLRGLELPGLTMTAREARPTASCHMRLEIASHVQTCLGPGARRILEAAAAARAFTDGAQLLACLRLLARGIPLRQLAPAAAREEADALLMAIAARAARDVSAWSHDNAIPLTEITRMLTALERACLQSGWSVTQAMAVERDHDALVLKLCLRIIANAPAFADDIAGRDMAVRVVRSALTAALAYATPLHSFDFAIARPSAQSA